MEIFKEVRTSLNQDETKNDAEARNDVWSIEGDSIYRHHVEPRVEVYVPKEERFPNPLKYIDVIRTTDTNLDVLQEGRTEDHRNMDVDRHFSDSWTGGHEVPNIE